MSDPIGMKVLDEGLEPYKADLKDEGHTEAQIDQEVEAFYAGAAVALNYVFDVMGEKTDVKTRGHKLNVLRTELAQHFLKETVN